jgi:hypothetical protein
MKRTLMIAAATLTLAACGAKTVELDIDVSKATYLIDPRTNLCFAAWDRVKGNDISGVAESFSITNVPCTDDVMKLIKSR